MSRLSAPNDTHLSKKLSWVLRHGAHELGMPIGADGFVPVDAILKHPDFAAHYTLDTLKRLVQNDAKQRYTLQQSTQTNKYAIKANQGHSMHSVEAEKCLTLIQKAEDVPLAVHGTYYRHWSKIRAEGLKCMGRNHIHFAATDKLLPGGTSGFRNDCQLLIYLNVNKAMIEGGMLLYRSQNNVILTSGCDGRIDKKFFFKVVDRKSNTKIEF